METIDLNVNGMTCGSCVASVTRTLQRIPGVGAVAVDLSSGTARVATSGSVAIATLIKALAAAGYESSARSRKSPVAGPVAPENERGSTSRQGGGCCCR